MGLGQPPLRRLAQLALGERFHAVQADLVIGVAQAESVKLGQALGRGHTPKSLKAHFTGEESLCMNETKLVL